MAQVYKGTDLLLERPVAVKVLQPELTSNSAELERFKREGMALAGVASPHVVGVYDIGIDDGSPYLVMQYVAGITISQQVQQLGTITPVRAASLLGQLLHGLATLHAAGLVHRDIKPSNVLVGAHDHVVLVDLGVAFNRRKKSLTAPGHVAGTPEYLAPEYLEHGRVDARSDLYQVGLLMLYMMTGIEPSGVGRTLEPLLAQMPYTFEPIARRAVAPTGERFTSATAMATALGSGIADCSTTKMPALDLPSPLGRTDHVTVRLKQAAIFGAGSDVDVKPLPTGTAIAASSISTSSSRGTPGSTPIKRDVPRVAMKALALELAAEPDHVGE